jgi:hypothetical protein
MLFHVAVKDFHEALGFEVNPVLCMTRRIAPG